MSSALAVTTHEPPRRARLGGYAFWQLRDYLVDRGLPTVLITLLFGYLAVAPVRAMVRGTALLAPRLIAKYGSQEAARAAMYHDASAMLLRNLLGAIIFLGALFAMNGIVANDRKLGYYRFLFSKPMTPERYYGQAFGLHSLGWLIVMALVALLYGAVLAPILTPSFMAGIGLVYLCYAGIGFLLSAVARWDWLSLVFVTVATTVLRDRYGSSSSTLVRLLDVLPPLHRTQEVYGALADGVALPWHSLAWLGGYGAVCFVLGLVVLHSRRLAIV